MKIVKSLRVFLIVCGLLCVSLPVFAQESVELFHDTLWIGNSDNDSAPSPIINQWGVSLQFHASGEWYFAPEISVYYGLEYFFRDGKALPAEIEYADAVKTFDIFLGAPFFYLFSPSDDFLIRVGTGPAFSFKIPVRTYGEGSAGDVGGYFTEKGRFIHWEIAAVFEWKFFPQLSFCLRPRLVIPLYRLWDGDELPLYDGMMVGAGFGLRLGL